MSQRYFASEPILGERATLVGAEAHHLLHVLRAVPGQEIMILDGTGREFTARITHCGRQEIQLDIVSTRQVSRELAATI
jgi:16S rRNA (uracil1498-N3)-methyltransferase